MVLKVFVHELSLFWYDGVLLLHRIDISKALDRGVSGGKIEEQRITTPPPPPPRTVTSLKNCDL